MAVVLTLLSACAPKYLRVTEPIHTAADFLKVVEQDYFRHGKDGSCAIDTVRSDGWILVLCGRPDGTVRQYDTWLR